MPFKMNMKDMNMKHFIYLEKMYVSLNDSDPPKKTYRFISNSTSWRTVT